MSVDYEEMKGYLHYYARRFAGRHYEKEELMSEAWIAVHNLDNPAFLSNGIRWAMLRYIKDSIRELRRGNQKVFIVSLDEEINEMSPLKDSMFDPFNYYEHVDHSDTLCHLDRFLTLRERLLLDQRYHQDLTLKEMAKIHGCTRSNIGFLIQRILKKMKDVA